MKGNFCILSMRREKKEKGREIHQNHIVNISSTCAPQLESLWCTTFNIIVEDDV